MTPSERIVQTFEWEGDAGARAGRDGDVRGPGRADPSADVSLFHTREERDGMLESGMEDGMSESHARFDELMERLGPG